MSPTSLFFFPQYVLKPTGQLKGPNNCKIACSKVHPVYLGLTSHFQPIRLGGLSSCPVYFGIPTAGFQQQRL